MYHRQLHGSKTRLLGRGFHTLMRNVSFPSPADVGSHNPPPLGTSVRAGTPLGVCLLYYLQQPKLTKPTASKYCLLLPVSSDTRERLPHPYNECFVPLSNQCRISRSTPFRSPTSLPAHRSVSGSDIICNSPSPPLVDIVCFGSLCITISLTVIRMLSPEERWIMRSHIG